MDSKLQELKDRYKLLWKDWYYWPMEEEEGGKEARRRLDEVSLELNRYQKNLHV